MKRIKIYKFHFSIDFSGCVTGLLKVGEKNLYVFDENGETKMVMAPCVLDFYIHESRQRAGLGKELFEAMLERENYQPHKLAIDRPSDKLVAFLRKHYGNCQSNVQLKLLTIFQSESMTFINLIFRFGTNDSTNE